MKTNSIRNKVRGIACVSLLLLNPASLLAENVFVTGWKGLNSSSDQTPAPLSTIDGGFAPAGAGPASTSLVSPTPVIPNSDRRIHYGRFVGATWTLTPSNVSVTPVSPVGKGPYNFTALQNIGVYKLYLTKGQDNNASTNIIVQMSASGGDLADTNGVSSPTILLDMFQKGKTNHTWVHVGYLTNSILSPTITLQHFSGEINDIGGATNNAQRWYTDAIRFEYLDQCAGVATEVKVSGPLVQGQNFVNVSGVAAGATNVTVYANQVLIGSTNKPSGFDAGDLTVLVSPNLIKGNSITAGQIKNGCVGTVPTTGPIVGSGPNAQLKASLSLWKSASFAGPIGANGSNSSGVNYFLKATGFIAAFGTAPNGGAPLTPGQCWQTVTFDHSTDPAINSNGTATEPFDPFCALDGLLFSIVDDESGPYDIYVDQIMNGDVVIENFEGQAAGSSRLFAAPNQAISPNPSATFVSAPSSSLVSQNNAFEGTNSCRVQWQWIDGNETRWARLPANMTNSAKFYPQLDTTKPITIRYLVLPSGQTNDKLSFLTVPANQTKGIGQSVTFTASPTGDAPYSYQWSFAGSPITDATTSSYTKSNLQVADAGSYSVLVTGASCNATLSASLTVSEVVAPPTLNYTRGSGQINFTWSGNFMLQSRTAVDTGSWTDINASGTYSEPLNSSATKFFRLRSN